MEVTAGYDFACNHLHGKKLITDYFVALGLHLLDETAVHGQMGSDEVPIGGKIYQTELELVEWAIVTQL